MFGNCTVLCCLLYIQLSFSLFTTNIRDVSFMNAGISAKKSCVSYPGPGQNRLMLHADSSSLLKPSTPHHGCNAHRQTHSHMSQLGSMLVLYWLGTVNLNLNGKAPSFIDYHLSKSILNSAYTLQVHNRLQEEVKLVDAQKPSLNVTYF